MIFAYTVTLGVFFRHSMREYGLREEIFEVGEMKHMNLLEMNEPINIEQSSADSRSLIMPHQQEAVDALSKYFHVEKLIRR